MGAAASGAVFNMSGLHAWSGRRIFGFIEVLIGKCQQGKIGYSQQAASRAFVSSLVSRKSQPNSVTSAPYFTDA